MAVCWREVECGIDEFDVDAVRAEFPVEVIVARLKVGQERDAVRETGSAR